MRTEQKSSIVLDVARPRKGAGGSAHRFGGDWTDEKLAAIGKYLSAYTTALTGKFKLAYIDAFAGTGYRTSRRIDDDASLLFPDLAATETSKMLDGSATIALKTKPRFNKCIFIERDPARCAALAGLRDEFSDLAADIDVRQVEANSEIQRLCKLNWRANRAVLFLDPYGMQVEWETIKAVAGTRAIDLWLLFPLGIGVNRLLTRSGDIPPDWRSSLDRLLGKTDWWDAFYKVTTIKNLLGEEERRVEKASIDVIGSYFVDRLRSVFEKVSEPKVLKNRANCPLYLLCFAAGNPKGAPIAVGIANHILKVA
jgi:three-Cys-motif partner protein